MKKVASDENRHYLFYRDLVTAALEIDPSGTVIAIERQVRTFEMPGTGILDFEVHAKAIANAGIYDFAVHHDQILVPVVLRHWDIEALEGLDARGRAGSGCAGEADRPHRQGRPALRRPTRAKRGSWPRSEAATRRAGQRHRQGVLVGPPEEHDAQARPSSERSPSPDGGHRRCAAGCRPPG